MSRHPGPGPNQGLPSAQGWEIPSEREARSPLPASKQTHQHLNQKHSRGGRGGAMPGFQLASASPPPGCCPPQRSPYCHTGPATWPVISGQGEGEVKPDWGCVCVCAANPQTSLQGLATPCGRPSYRPSPGPHPPPSPLVPALGQGRPWPRLGCTRWGARKGK